MNKLVNYSDDSSNESCGDETLIEAIDKRTDKKNFLKRKKPKQSLPLPSKIKCMFEANENTADDNRLHDGRKRGFEHVEGNWPTYIYIPLNNVTNFFEEHQRKIINTLKKLLHCQIHGFTPKECHISISRTVPVRHYWIEPIFNKIRELLILKRAFQYSLESVQVYTNDDKSRTFIGIKVANSHSSFVELTELIDQIFEEFGLEKYYTSPSFHVSIAWCLGDKKIEIEKILKTEGNLASNVLHYMATEKVCMKSGNKVYQFYFQ